MSALQIPLQKSHLAIPRSGLEHLYFPSEVMRVCICWYTAYPLGRDYPEKTMICTCGNPHDMESVASPLVVEAADCRRGFA